MIKVHAEPPRPKEVTEAQARHLKANPACAICGRTGASQAHHILDYDACQRIGMVWIAADPRDFVTLCETEQGKPEPNHHLLAGHYGSFKSINLNIMDELALPLWQKKTAAEIEADPVYQVKVKDRIKPVAEWGSEDITAMQVIAARIFPKDQGGQK